MPVTKAEIEKALDELIDNEEGFRFQTLATILAKEKWPELIASEPKKDLGTDALISAWLAPNGKGLVLACSTSAMIGKLKADATKVRDNFPNVGVLVFSTPRAISNETISTWAEEIGRLFGYELIVITRRDIVLSLLVPRNASLCRTILHISVQIEPEVSELLERVAQSAHDVTAHWFSNRLANQFPVSVFEVLV